MDYYLAVLKKYVVFSGRARRAEYWMFALFSLIASIVLSIVDRIIGLQMGGSGVLQDLYGLAVLLPTIAVGVRRLHDTNRSGLWLLLAFVPFFGWIALLVFFVQDSDPGTNRYGENPKSAVMA